MQKISRFLRSTLTATMSTIVLALSLQGCTVLAIADTVGTVAVKTVGVAADVAIGTVKLTGKAVGAAADAVTPDSPPSQ
jgi:hypothetical protein